MAVWSKLGLLYEARFKPVRKVRTILLGVRRPYQRRELHHALILIPITARFRACLRPRYATVRRRRRTHSPCHCKDTALSVATKGFRMSGEILNS